MFSFPKVFSFAKSLSKAMFSSLTRGLHVLKIKLREVQNANNYNCQKERKAETAIYQWNFYVQHQICFGVIHQIMLCYLDDPNPLSILLLPFFFFSLAELCLDAYVNLTFMSCKTELSLINNLVILSCHRLQNSPYFCVFKHARAVKQKVWNET